MKPDPKGPGRLLDAALVAGCLLLFGMIAHRLWLRASVQPPAAAREDALPRIDFRRMEEVMPDENYHPVYSEDLLALNGKTVRIQGFMTPYDSLQDMSTFMLFPFPTGCNFCAPPAINQVVLIRQPPGPRRRPYLEGAIEVTGRLNLWRADSEDPAHTGDMFLFVLDDAAVREIPITPALRQTDHWRHTGP